MSQIGMKSHREFVEAQCQDPEFARAYTQARHEAAFAVALARLREDQGLTQKGLEERTGIRQPVLARYERGALPNLANLQKLAAALNARVTIQPSGAVQIEPLSVRKRGRPKGSRRPAAEPAHYSQE